MLSHPSQQLRGMLCAVCTWAFLIFVFPAPALTQAEQDTTEQETKVELERIEVTGTRIRRVDAEGALPVTVITRDMIELSGESSLADFLRSLSFNSFGSYRSQSGDSRGGNSTIDLRGLGTSRSLVLIDGRRLPKAPTWQEGGVNLNTIPMGSVERIEILSDGASAIYGSDAIGGVINIITRDDYRGWEFSMGRSRVNVGGGGRSFGSAMYGWSDSRTKLLVTASWNDQEIAYAKDFAWSADGVATFFGNNFMTVDPATGFPNWDLTAVPGGCTDSEAFVLVPDERSLSGDVCTYQFSLVSADETSIATRGGLLKIERELGADWIAWSNLSQSYTDSLGRYAPLPFTTLWWNIPVPPESPNNPTNPASGLYDPGFGPNVPVHIFHRFDSLGTRDWLWDTRLTDLQGGLTGWLGGFEVDVGVRTARTVTGLESRNFPDDDIQLEYILDGTYDLQFPLGNPDSVLDAMRVNHHDEWHYDQEEVFASVAWDLFEIGSEPVRWVFGGEYRRDRYENIYSQYYSALGDEGGFESADRSTTSLFFETLLPLNQDLEMSIAGRHDEYSDWGSDFSPKVSMRWRATEQLVFRASWGEGFRAPHLVINALEPTEEVDFTDSDPQSCGAIGREPGCWIVFTSTWKVSPALGAEHSEQFSFGLAWEPADWFNMTADFYEIELTDEIYQFWPGDIHFAEQNGLPLPEGLGVHRDPSGLLLSIDAGWGNLGLVQTSGLDLNMKFDFEIGPGLWHSNLQYSHVFDFRYRDIYGATPNLIGRPGRPRARATLSSDYEISDFTLSWNTHYIASQYEDFDWDNDIGLGHLPSWVTHDLQFSYHASWDGKVTVGAQNAFNKQPPLGGRSGVRDYNFHLYNGWGRIWYAEYTQTFD